jgi:hypothetical protein
MANKYAGSIFHFLLSGLRQLLVKIVLPMEITVVS